mgnify:CR=1 FL=1
MAYQVLARKWRPRSFETLVGQEHVVRALTHALSTGRLHHAYLFTGTRGVGKTTISRILAKALNCETGVTPTPCNQCSACLAIDADRFPDYVEMDAASNRGVDDMAALLDQAVYAPVQGRYKVYMIDEVHMLTGHAFNAMLKTLEEPPEHVKFIIATTDPQKIPVTVLSRCLQFNLKQMPPAHIVGHLTRLLEAEAVPFEPGALRHLAKAAGGSMRDALSLLDQAIAHGAGKVEEQAVQDMLGTVGDDHLYAILDALVAQDVQALMAAAEGMEARSLSFDSALQSLANSQDSTGEYVFAGYRSNTQPFVGSMAGGITYQGDQGARTLQISSSRNLPITSSGEEIFNRIRAPIGSGFALSAAANTGTALVSGASLSGYNGHTYAINVGAGPTYQVFDSTVDPTHASPIAPTVATSGSGELKTKRAYRKGQLLTLAARQRRGELAAAFGEARESAIDVVQRARRAGTVAPAPAGRDPPGCAPGGQLHLYALSAAPALVPVLGRRCPRRSGRSGFLVHRHCADAAHRGRGRTPHRKPPLHPARFPVSHDVPPFAGPARGRLPP